MAECVVCGAGLVPTGLGGAPRVTCSEECRLERLKQNWQRAAARRGPVPPRTIVCVVCGSEFVGRHRVRFCGDACRGEHSRRRQREGYARLSPEQLRARHRKTRLRHYGLTGEEWDQLFDAQGRVCGACGTGDPGRYWHTDHCHATGVVRGILCLNCNSALGLLRDSRAVLAGLDAYLGRFA